MFLKVIEYILEYVREAQLSNWKLDYDENYEGNSYRIQPYTDKKAHLPNTEWR